MRSMRKPDKRFLFVLSLAALVFMSIPVTAANSEAPAKLQAALFFKVLPWYTNLGNEPFTIHVIGGDDVASEFKSFVGQNAGQAKLSDVTSGATISGSPKVVYFGNEDGAGLTYCQSKQALSITGNTELVPKGVTLGVGIGANGKPKFVLNLSSSKNEGVQWNPAILKVAETLK